MKRLSVLIGTAALACALSMPAQAAPILGQELIATGGDVVVTFVSNGAGYTSELYLDGPDGDALGSIFNNQTTPVSTSLNLGAFLAGTELIFRLEVKNTGQVFYSGEGSRNPDGIAHAVVDSRQNQAQVGFEDLFGGGDRDYNDLVFSFSNVSGGTSSAQSGGPSGLAVGGPSGLAVGGPSVPAVGGSPVLAVGGPSVLAVDEPSTLVLFGVGLAGLLLVMRRQALRR
jgi:hypothetical protein